ncbi:hypothetical protein A2982_03130 [candidate division WWE3 bacterium RIFCSPLOWO2_01_FULL_39_13]|uniref:Uncharacterized protein n=1 Tax=candidate division WWE3 bacterium RIFCSPLOWO2_01_FULL_39_13 TaxID=1802624 RepID=A0A1F4V3S0_UNCKA|nr:MAG: hypothetical protein A2982_03130 [candidate division WWE3 bacterium RIFCSPLOWO2_01_FULL_39_13]
MKNLGQILAHLEEKDTGKYISHEWQLFGYRLAKWMQDTDRISMYMKLAKNEKRDLLQKAWDFVKESKPRTKSRLFLWKLTLLKKETAGITAKDKASLKSALKSQT